MTKAFQTALRNYGSSLLRFFSQMLFGHHVGVHSGTPTWRPLQSSEFSKFCFPNNLAAINAAKRYI